MKKILISTFTIIVISIFIRVYFGVYVHDEYGEQHIFLKYRATWKWKFYSPIGMSDIKIEELTENEQIEEKSYEEFVRQKIKL